MLTDPFIAFQQAHSDHVWGKYAGIVIDNQDPENCGRLQVSCPAVLGDASVWAMPCVPYAGPGVGMYFIPPVGAGVWVEFEGGKVSRPIWTGCYWSKDQLPQAATSPDIKLIVTASVSLTIDDSSGEVVLKNNTEASTTWSDKVVTEAGQATHSVGAEGVVSQSAGSVGKVEVSDSGVSVNSGAFSVM
ncbi:phage baseplate assembly protein V [Novosphingobium sp.]|uniref:phage baseplate assembly protein V n=1 Tax=Novosphingobium sp. TaxID=1874826 RepID=UPI003BADBA93